MTSVTIPSSVTSIANGAFDPTILTDVTINTTALNGVNNYFQNYSKLKSATFGTGVVGIANGSGTIGFFRGCTELTSVTLPDSLTFIGDFTFTNCTKLVFTIPNAVRHIGNGAFGGCSLMTNVTIPSSITNIGNPFDSAILTDVTINTNALFANGVNNYFLNYTKLKSATFGSGVNGISSSATGDTRGFFTGCTGLTSVTIPNSLTFIGDSAFRNCTSLVFTIPNTVRHIGSGAFVGCSLMTNVTIPSSITSIGGPFDSNIITDITINTNIFFANGVSNYFYNWQNLKSAILGTGVKGISSAPTGDTRGFFAACTKLTSVTLPDSLTFIGDYAFNGCTNLTSITFLNVTALPTINSTAFNNISTNSTAYYYSFFSSSNANTILKTNAKIANAVRVIVSSYLPTRVDQTTNFTLIYSNILYPPIQNNTYNLTYVYQGEQTTLSSYVSQPGDTTYTFPDANILTAGVNILSITNTSTNPTTIIDNNINISVNVICFKEDTKILTDKGYVCIQHLKKGDLVKTSLNGYVPINMIGKSQIYNIACEERIKNQLYKCSKEQYPELLEDLIITGCHSILVDNFLDDKQRENAINVNGGIYVTDEKYRLPACVDERTNVYDNKGEHNIYHLALDNDNYYYNYGIYANGLLVETCSKRYLSELSNMTLL
jgi:hypothetical protein